MIYNDYFKKTISIIKNIHNRCYMKFINSQKKNGESTCKFIIIGDDSDDTMNRTDMMMGEKYFKYLRCDEKQILIKININNFCKKLDVINLHSEIMFYIKKDNINLLFINIITDKNSDNVISIPLMEQDYNKIDPSKIVFDGKLLIYTKKFFDICKQIACSSKTINIITDKKTISFVYTHGKNTKNIDGSINVDTENETENLGTYDLITLSLISDFYEVDLEMNIYFKKNILVFTIPIGFGKIYFLIESKK
ncbi:proliferating cell nuclear antigen [Acanthamoeba polyphaga mimivirus]|uniref:Proliferating cell nuclear antigen n=1 Tax=Acanthamoeba polyphaga mimivirus TaxID=212035 RepID=A0A0G2XZW0_MIMIV|nr:proliferating cell nuclear antigen [Acanthamoeba polyphaga mimivirus]